MFGRLSKEWKTIINVARVKDIAKNIAKTTPDAKLCPPKALWFEWARLTPINSIKVIIIGQDPYSTPGVATGLAFSCKKMQPSLDNILRCQLYSGLIDSVNPNLEHWAEQGVLLLNMALSTEQNKPNQHKKYWKDFTVDIIKHVSQYGIDNEKKYIFYLWGNEAKSVDKYISDHHIKIYNYHPSPLIQNRLASKEMFINSKQFLECDKNDIKIEWDKNFYMPTVDEKTVHVFTDGSCSKNGDKTGKAKAFYGAIFVKGPYKNKYIFGELMGNKRTNIRAEGYGILSALKFLKSEFCKNEDNLEDSKNKFDRAVIYSDSQHWISMIKEFMPYWDKKKFDTMSNPDLTIRIWKIWSEFPTEIQIRFVPAHNKTGWKTSENKYRRWCHHNNDKVDRLINKKAKALKNQ